MRKGTVLDELCSAARTMFCPASAGLLCDFLAALKMAVAVTRKTEKKLEEMYNKINKEDLPHDTIDRGLMILYII